MSLVRVADYVFQTLADHGTRHVFLVTGGGAMHLNDALGREGRIRYICCHHEQAAAMAAEAYARVSGRVGIVNVTTGPGGINALNGVFGAWTDSVPMLVISGQVKRATLLATHGLQGRLRQLGDQEADIVGMVAGITKMATVVTEPENIRYHLERALHLATTGRPGPVWLDIPVDVQAMPVDPRGLRGYGPVEVDPRVDPKRLRVQCTETLERLAKAERPVILAGGGIRCSAGGLAAFERVRERLGVPVVTAWTHDLIASDDPLFCGRQGSIGDRAGNFAVQNSDVLLTLGSRLGIRHVSYNGEFFARHAYKIQVDADPAEMEKPTGQPDLPIVADVRAFLETLEGVLDERGWPVTGGLKSQAGWRAWCLQRRERYPAYQPERHVSRAGAINPYHFAHVFFEELADDDVVACGDGAATVTFGQCARLQRGQRLFANSGSASMGYDLPAAIGAAVARGNGQRVICVAGDGSLQMNVQELQTVAHHRFSIKLVVLNNGGYASIRQTQAGFFQGHFVGSGPSSGVSFPDHVKLAEAYGLPAVRLDGLDFREGFRRFLAREGPGVCEVMLDPAQDFEPKLGSRRLPDGTLRSSPLEDMTPFLSREELAENMIVPILE